MTNKKSIPHTYFIVALLAIYSFFLSSSVSAFSSSCSWYNDSGTPVLIASHTYSASDATFGNTINIFSALTLPSYASAQNYWTTSPGGGQEGHESVVSFGTTYSFYSDAHIGTLSGGSFTPAISSGCTGSFDFNLPTTSISISPSVVNVGDPVAITWSSSYATTCTFDGSPITTSGVHNFTAALSDSRSYTLSCSNQWGSDSDTATLTVN